ncbi:DUF3375 domain-containing protein [Mycobacterium kiyosense]|uniref:DUF3375 domain-containing protein n=1 Tax=Mycobacterium kiyosense TaxID=2871094 RepID=UPI00216D8FE5|nr:DUF3375 domain-containing protein [Mycobacterium kiyosense]GLB91912.1 hypothetical protein SRL2020130_47290 [Mycobacterium kiyosense]GLC03745.1 hypothetical protein SRL2020400_43360 [Mycobacterium kiyosense]GLC08975.1 hypothetical protein SRL2020411_36210 [Mycobacterium kiyosense]GLC16831.1 hypothetical protein SRL2020448_54340 [Mycobacterium kiyosense]GLC22428.1 hypothetical protein SRL2020472_49990 [Mycobacterium kiyosense]
MDDYAGLSATDLLALNRDLQGSRAVRLLATLNLGLYATLMERHLSDTAVPETELVVRLERDLAELGEPQSGLALIKSWAGQGWLHRVVDSRAGHEQNLCYLTQDTRRALDFLRGMRRQDTIATGGSITGLAARLKQVALRVDSDPARIRKQIEAEIDALHQQLDQLDAGQRPAPDVTDCYDEARAIALQMERLITDIGQYGAMIEQATAALDEPIDSNVEYRDRQRQMYSDYQAAWDSRGRDSHRAFLRMVNDPDQRAEFEADVAAVADALPALDPDLRKIMTGFFELVGHQIDEVERIQQRCAQRVKRFTAFGTMEQRRGVARQLNQAIGAARALLKTSLTDSRLDIDVPLARHAISSVGALSFKIGDLSRPKPAEAATGEVDLTTFAALTTQVDAPAMADALNDSLRKGPVSLPDAVAMLDTAYLGHVIVLWSWALKQPQDGTVGSTAVRFRSLAGPDREIELPRLTFTEPITTLAGAGT